MWAINQFIEAGPSCRHDCTAKTCLLLQEQRLSLVQMQPKGEFRLLCRSASAPAVILPARVAPASTAGTIYMHNINAEQAQQKRRAGKTKTPSRYNGNAERARQKQNKNAEQAQRKQRAGRPKNDKANRRTPNKRKTRKPTNKTRVKFIFFGGGGGGGGDKYVRFRTHYSPTTLRGGAVIRTPDGPKKLGLGPG